MSDLFSVAGNTAPVTGRASGLGRMMAEALLAGRAWAFITLRSTANAAGRLVFLASRAGAYLRGVAIRLDEGLTSCR